MPSPPRLSASATGDPSSYRSPRAACGPPATRSFSRTTVCGSPLPCRPSSSTSPHHKPSRGNSAKRAAVLTGVDEPLEILGLVQEGPKAGEVRVEVKAAGVCMSDWHIMNGDWPLPLPMVLGHEAAGVVIELGAEVHNVKKGD